VRLTVAPGEGGSRLDRFVSARLPDVSRATVMKYLKEGHARINGRRARAGLFVADGDEVDLPEFEPAVDRIRAGQAEGVPEVERVEPPRGIEILYEDEHLIAVAKPPGLVMHPGAGHEGEGLDGLLRQHFGRNVRLVHRIDRDTSGVVVAARGHPQSARRLSDAFRRGDNEKVYVALVRGVPGADRGVIDAPLLDTKAEGERVHVDEHGKPARTDWELLEAFPGWGWLRLTPHTGRRHQIRAHLAFLGHPLAVDRTYAHKRRLTLHELRPDLPVTWKNPVVLTRQPLHAASLTLRHPATGKDLTIDCPLPEDLSRVLDLLRS